MPDFKALQASQASTPLISNQFQQSTSELRKCSYWSKWTEDASTSCLLSLNSLIDKIDVVRNQIVVTTGGKASIHKWNAEEAVPKSFATFQVSTSKKHRNAFGGVLRSSDCALLAIGSSDSRCRIYTVKEGTNRSCLRELKDVGLQSECHCCSFIGQTQLLSTYDNGSIRCFDIATSVVDSSVNGLHSGQIRALDVSEQLNLALTGSHDRSALLLDYRLLGQPSSVAVNFHKSTDPVLAVSLIADRNMVMLAAGQHVQVFDLRKADDSVFSMDAHYGSILAMRYLKISNKGEFFLAGGTDKMLQIYDISRSNGQPNHIHSVRASSSITSLGCEQFNPDFVAIACEDGTVEFMVNKNTNQSSSEKPTTKLKPFEVMLKKFDVFDAMDDVLHNSNGPYDFVDLVSELINRGQLEHSLLGRDASLICKHICDGFSQLPGRADVLISVTVALVKMINRERISINDQDLNDLLAIIDKEMNLQIDLLRLKGVYNTKLHSLNNNTDS
ncbi:hypothetical protein GJ496_010077 [Pomphorhynchus laevis]|nr:hypothetical protein GJ496_010077 [Pomphorhynchus laevis]